MDDLKRATTVLVVDDEAQIRMFAVDILEDEGFATLEAGDAEEALELLDEHPEITVLFTDINMPGPFDGLKLARQVHARRADLQLILTSGRVRPTSEEIPDYGKFVAKPYEARALTGLVRTVV